MNLEDRYPWQLENWFKLLMDHKLLASGRSRSATAVALYRSLKMCATEYRQNLVNSSLIQLIWGCCNLQEPSQIEIGQCHNLT